MSLNDEIRAAQIRAGEDAVMNNLVKKGLIDPPPAPVPITVAARIRELEAERDALQSIVAALHMAITGLRRIMNSAESNASGNPEWESVNLRVGIAREAIADTATIAAAHDARVRNEAIEECAKECEHKGANDYADRCTVESDTGATNCPEWVNNHQESCEDCATAIRALKTEVGK